MADVQSPPLPTKVELAHLFNILSNLKVRDLSAICAAHGLPKTGVKNDLKVRITQEINRTAKSPHHRHLFNAIRRTIHYQVFGEGHDDHYASSSAHPSAAYPSPNMTQLTNQPVYGYAAPNGIRIPSGVPMSQTIRFSHSPFYDVETTLQVKTLEPVTHHRHTTEINISLATFPSLQRCLTDPSLRVMIFCAAANTDVQDIAFPHQCEIKVNGGEVKANLRGLKGKPGSTRPVDITPLLRLKPSTYSNKLDFLYALTSKRFYFVLQLCKTHSVPNLVEITRNRGRISKASVVQELTKQARDPDIEATSQVLSLKCPLSYMRLDLPVRSLSCKHIQCFDATSYLQLQEQGPQWLCPICNKAAPFQHLAVDEYVKDILAKTSKSQEQVIIEPDGQWRANNGSEDAAPKEEPSYDASYIDDDDDALIISNFGGGGKTLATPNRSVQRIATPLTVGSREGSSMPRSGSKRPIAEVIDLTLSDDDEPAPPPKRQNMGHSAATLNGVNDLAPFPW